MHNRRTSLTVWSCEYVAFRMGNQKSTTVLQTQRFGIYFTQRIWVETVSCCGMINASNMLWIECDTYLDAAPVTTAGWLMPHATAEECSNAGVVQDEGTGEGGVHKYDAAKPCCPTDPARAQHTRLLTAHLSLPRARGDGHSLPTIRLKPQGHDRTSSCIALG
jgi:hypothetical protein